MVEDTNDNDDDLDTSWIQRETQIQNIQANCCRERMESIRGIFIYINQNNYIEKLTIEMITLTGADSYAGSYITPDVLLKLIQTKKLRTPISKYKLTNIFTYIVDIDPDKIQAFSKTSDCNICNNSFFKENSIAESITIPPSIFIFHTINTLYFIFQEVLISKHNQTLKSILKIKDNCKNEETDVNQYHNITKKVRIVENHDIKSDYKKLMRKRGTRKRRM